MMVPPVIARQRLASQRLSLEQFRTPEDVVDWLGAVQAQDYPGAKWSLGLRMAPNELPAAGDEVVEQAFNAGTILRTHVMRPTWHFVRPADLRWMLELTAPRLIAAYAGVYRKLGLDEALLRRCGAVLARAAEGGRWCTRPELGRALVSAGIQAEGMRLNHILMRAELDGILCSGPRRGKQFTYARLDERAPHSRSLPRDEALAELARRYFTGHGPATVHDFAWWSGLTVADAKAGLALAGPTGPTSGLERREIEGQTYYFPDSLPAGTEPVAQAFLLPTYDEFLVGYSAFDRLRRGGQVANQIFRFQARIVLDGRIVGSWLRTFKKNAVIVEIDQVEPLNPVECAAVAAAARRYGDFVGMPVVLEGEPE